MNKIIYLSIGNDYREQTLNMIDILKVKFPNHTVRIFEGGTYDPRIIETADILVSYIPYNHILGTGVYGEINRAIKLGKTVYHYRHETRKFYNDFGTTLINQNDWRNYVKVELYGEATLITPLKNNNLFYYYAKQNRKRLH